MEPEAALVADAPADGLLLVDAEAAAGADADADADDAETEDDAEVEDKEDEEDEDDAVPTVADMAASFFESGSGEATAFLSVGSSLIDEFRSEIADRVSLSRGEEMPPPPPPPPPMWL